MYCDFFGLRCRPFEDRADAEFFCPLADSEEALAAMEYESHYGKGMALVMGDSGMGKTLLIRALLPRLDKSDHVVVVTWPQTGQRDLVRAVAKGFGVSLPSSHRDTRCISRLRRSLTRALKGGHRSILIIDQAENLMSDQLAQLATLADFEHDGTKLLNILLVGQPRVQALLNQPDFARLRQQLFGERTLKPLSLESAKEYMKHRIRVAGGGGTEVFDDDAIALIHEASGGIPRLINHMCNAAMLAAYGAGEKRIHRALAAEVVGRACQSERSAAASELAVSSVDDVAAGLTGTGSRGVSAGLERSDLDGTKESSRTRDGVGDTSTHLDLAASRPWETEEVPDPVRTDLINHISGEPVASSHDQGDSLFGDPGESSVVDVEDIVTRLERALARADRVSATTEASLAQHQAVEKHLSSLSTGAERIAVRLTSAMERSSEVWGALQHRVEKVVSDGEQRAESIEAQVSRVAEVSGETSEQIQRIENACRHSEGIESNLRLYAERLADKADEVQQRTALLMKTVETGKSAQIDLDEAVERADSSTEAAKRKIESGLSRLAGAKQEAEEALEGKLQQFMDRTSTATADGDETVDLMRATLEDSKEALEGKFQDLMDRASAVTADGDETVGMIRATLKEVKAEAGAVKRRFIDEVMPGCREEIQTQFDAQLRRHQESIEAMFASHRVSMQKLIDESTPRLRSMEQAVVDGRRNADDVISSCQQSIAELRESVGAGVDELREQMDTLECRHDDAQLSVSALCDDVGKATSQVRDLAVSVEDATSTVDAFDQRAEACRANLTNTLQQGDSLLQGMQTECGRAEATQRNLNASLIEVGAAGERIGIMGDRIAEGERVLTVLSTQQSEGANTAERLEELGASGLQLHDALQNLVAHADGKLGQLDSHSAAATRILRDLAGANTTAHELKQRVDEVLESARHAASEAGNTYADSEQRSAIASEKLERLSQEVVGLVSRVDESIETLQTANTTGGELVDKIAAASRPASETLDGLVAALEGARRHLDDVVDRRREVDESAGRLQTLTDALESTRDLQIGMEEATSRARTANDELATVTDTATRHATAFAEFKESAESQTGAMEKLRSEVEAAGGKLVAQKEAADRSVKVGGSLLGEFITRARAAEQRIGEFEERADKVEQVLREATSAPAEVVAAAQAQAAQLERVCSAVRKIFGAVSKASLSAKQQSAQCYEVSEQSARRLAQLSSETDRATATIREWVEEAKRAQARLEGTLRSCPSIAETHPAENLHQLSDVLSSAGRFSGAGRISGGVAGEVKTLSEPGLPQAAEPRLPSARPKRSDEIASLIQDAKEAVVEAKA